MYVYDLTNDTTLTLTTPVDTWDPAGINQIYGAAISNGFMWLTSGSGQTYGYIVPEPTASVLLVTGLIGLLACAWHKRR